VAERLKDWPTTPRVRRYPWHEWMDGSPWRLEPGVDFTGTFKNMRATIVNHAKRNDIAVRTKVERDMSRPERPERWLYLQFFPGRPFASRRREEGPG
jgi:hypothetical protein